MFCVEGQTFLINDHHATIKTTTCQFSSFHTMMMMMLHGKINSSATMYMLARMIVSMLCTRNLSCIYTTAFILPKVRIKQHVVVVVGHHRVQDSRTSNIPRFSSSFDEGGTIGNEDALHNVHGIECRSLNINLQKVGYVSILEATADAQNNLVDMALATEAEMNENENRLQSGDPYGAVLWPAASAVANHLLSLDSCINGKKIDEVTVLELGSGTGLVSIAAALGGVSKIMATDYEQVPLQLLEFAAKHLNKDSDTQENVDLSSKIETFLFDICDKSSPLPFADIVVAADIMYEPKTGIAMAHRVVEALENGSRVIVGCSPGR